MLTSCGLHWISWNILRDQPRHASAATLSNDARGVEIDIVVTRIPQFRNLLYLRAIFFSHKSIDVSIRAM